MDAVAFQHLTDDVFNQLLRTSSTLSSVRRAKQLCENVLRRQLYPVVGKLRTQAHVDPSTVRYVVADLAGKRGVQGGGGFMLGRVRVPFSSFQSGIQKTKTSLSFRRGSLVG